MALVMEESIHVSSTSLSPVRLELLHLGHFLIGGESCLGSTGSLFSSGSMMRAQSLQYHTGMGVANIRCLDITQSQSSDLAQSLSRVLAYSGTHLSLAAFSTTSSVISLVFMNHCGREIISTGVLHRQHTPTLCVCGSVLVIFFWPVKSSAILFRASSVLSPLKRGSSTASLPFSVMALMRGSLYLFCHLTSILSPKVHTMTAPVPKEESTSGSSSIGTTWLNSGTVAFFPTIGLNLGSSGWTSMATQAGSSSGLVDATSSFRSSWPNSM